jgi:hypothetical protein
LKCLIVNVFLTKINQIYRHIIKPKAFEMTYLNLARRTLNAAHLAEQQGAMQTRDLLVGIAERLLADGKCREMPMRVTEDGNKTIPPMSLPIH